MYGTIAKVRVKPGQIDNLIKGTMAESMMQIPGIVNTFVYQMDSDPNELMMAVMFTDKDAYVKNADSPQQNERYEAFMKYLEGAPEWHDGEVIYNYK